MERELEILNEKLDYIYTEIMSLKEGLTRTTFEREEKELKYKVENAQEKLDMHKDHLKWQLEDIDERRKSYRSVRDRFPKNEI
jgi:predicted  nucleic acid-binding Zn-ribbon protein